MIVYKYIIIRVYSHGTCIVLRLQEQVRYIQGFELYVVSCVQYLTYLFVCNAVWYSLVQSFCL